MTSSSHPGGSASHVYPGPGCGVGDVLTPIRAAIPRERCGKAQEHTAQPWPESTQRPFSFGVGFCGAGRCFQNDASIFLRSTSNQKRLPDGAPV